VLLTCSSAAAWLRAASRADSALKIASCSARVRPEIPSRRVRHVGGRLAQEAGEHRRLVHAGFDHTLVAQLRERVHGLLAPDAVVVRIMQVDTGGGTVARKTAPQAQSERQAARIRQHTRCRE
jgi:hypothetical protein